MANSTSREDRPATAKQLKYLRTLADSAGQTFAYPRTVRAASAEIYRLLNENPSSRASAGSSASTSPMRSPAGLSTPRTSTSTVKPKASDLTVDGRIRCEPAQSLLAGILAATGVPGGRGAAENGRYERVLCHRAVVDSH
jgi:hypothetical protein